MQAELEAPPAPARPASRKMIWITAAVVVVALLLVPPILNLLAPPPSGTVLTKSVTDPDYLRVLTILERSCADCHLSDTKPPFYASFPIARGLIEKDRADGVRDLDMAEALLPPEGRPVDAVTLAKLEYVVEHGLMPPGRYTAIHWDRGLSKEERVTITSWIRSVRKTAHAVPGVSEEFAADPLQPLPLTVTADERKVALGKALFHDTRLSGDGTLSCASCHSLETGGVDRRPTSIGINGAVGPINAPTVFNAVFAVRQFWDGRAADLKEQAAGPVENPIEMGARFEDVVARLKQDEALTRTFAEIYPDGVTKENITDAIATFETTLVTPSRFDRYLRGERDALNADELEGLRLFRENACATCHVGPALGGLSFERLGRRADYFADRGGVTETDYGRFNVTGEERHRFAFKVPTLRNVAVTYPYFHDGSQKTLADAVRAMGRYQGRRPFTEAEVEKVVAFLHTLTGEYEGQLLK